MREGSALSASESVMSPKYPDLPAGFRSRLDYAVTRFDAMAAAAEALRDLRPGGGTPPTPSDIRLSLEAELRELRESARWEGEGAGGLPNGEPTSNTDAPVAEPLAIAHRSKPLVRLR